MKKLKNLLFKSSLIFTGGFFLFALPWIYVRYKSRSLIATVETALPAPVAIVFGAGLYSDGTPQPVLADRVQTAVDLYKSGVVRKLLMTGDNRSLNYNEPEAMRKMAVELGIPEKDIVLDFAGLRTYDSCYRAKFIFGVTKAILVTQEFHLPRAVYLCNALGVQAVGVPADRRSYRFSSMLSWQMRELAACFSAVLDVQLLHPQPVLGPKIPLE